MKPFLLLAAAITAGAPPYQIDLSRYFANRTAEQSQRTDVLARADAFVNASASALATPQDLAAWLRAYEALLVELRKHDAYVYLLAEEDSEDHAAEAADGVLETAMRRVDDATERTLAAIGPERLKALIDATPELAPYRHFVALASDRAAHANRNLEAVAALADPALRSLADSYKSLRPKPPAQGVAEGNPKATFDAKWTPYIQNEGVFAALLIPVVHLRDGEARLQGYAGAPEAAYAVAGLTAAQVNDALAAIRATDAAKRYDATMMAAAARRLGVSVDAVHTWDLQAVDVYHPPAVAFPDAITLILAAEQPMGREYAEQYSRLLDPQAHRLEWCHEARCDHTGFSVGFANVESAVFYGSYRGDTDSIRAVAHESGHAVHRQLMNEHQKLAVYNDGPHFMFESFAIFNELLLLDHLHRTDARSEGLLSAPVTR